MPSEPHDLNRLAALAEGRLDETERRHVEEHLAGCESCRSTVAIWSRGQLERPARARVKLPVWLGAAAAAALAAWIANRVASTPAAVGPTQPAAATAAPSLRPTMAGAPATAEPEPPDTRRGGERRVGEKTFHLVAGEWVDAAFDATAGLPIVEASGPAGKKQLLQREPALAPYLELGNRVTVVVGGTVYKLLPAP